jgi:hypothetical protein
MRYLVSGLLIALVADLTHSATGFGQSLSQFTNAIEQAPAQRSAIQQREIGPKETLVFVLRKTVGLVYFTTEPDGLRVVTTVRNSGGIPVRFVATLGADQTATVFLPDGTGDYSVIASFMRRDGRLIVKTPSDAGD